MIGFALLLFAIVAGSFLPLQAGINARLAHYVGGPVRASAISFFIGTVVLVIVVVLFTRGSARPDDAPWWAWIGGGLGAFYVTSTVVVPPRIGVAAFFGVVVAAQLVTSVVADRFGWFGLQERDITPLRAVGITLLIGGALLVRLF